jgi:hypothetical protein
MTETAAVPAPPAAATRQKMTHEQRLEKKRAYMAAKYLEPQFREAKRLDMVTRYHARVPDARWGIRGRRPTAANGAAGPADPAAPLAPAAPTTDDAASGASTPITNDHATTE